MPIESLPFHPVQYPVAHFEPVQGRPVIPTAAYAAQIAKAMEELFKQLSPEERKKKQLELDLLNQKSRQIHVENEYRERVLQNTKALQSFQQGVDSKKQSILNGPHDTTHPAIQTKPPPPDEPDTHPAEYHDSASAPGAAPVPIPIETSEPDPPPQETAELPPPPEESSALSDVT